MIIIIIMGRAWPPDYNNNYKAIIHYFSEGWTNPDTGVILSVSLIAIYIAVHYT